MAAHKDNPFQDPNFTPVEYDPQYILQVNHLKKYFPIKSGMISHTVGHVKAVDGVTFNLKRGTTMGLVGESGCGKTTTGRTLLRLYEPTDGTIIYDGHSIIQPPKRDDINVYRIDAMEEAARSGNSKVFNMLVLGGLLKVREIASVDDVVKGLHKALPERHHKLIPLNMDAIKVGGEIMQKQ